MANRKSLSRWSALRISASRAFHRLLYSLWIGDCFYVLDRSFPLVVCDRSFGKAMQRYDKKMRLATLSLILGNNGNEWEKIGKNQLVFLSFSWERMGKFFTLSPCENHRA